MSSDSKTFSIRPSSEGNHIVGEVNCDVPICSTTSEDATPSGGAVLASPNVQTLAPSANPTVTGTGPALPTLPSANSTVAVMVLYSPEAQTANGGDSGIRSIIVLQFGYFNEALLNSGCSVGGRLVYSAVTSWHHEAGSTGSDLGWLSVDSTTATLRDTYGADLVTYITTYGGGMAHLNTPFSVVDNTGYVFAHELGHNFGRHHNVEQDGSG
jgi:hypothetical protein